MGKIIGIDLGTTNSCMAVMEGGSPTVIANAEGNRTTPSIVAETKNKEKLVGQLAKRQAVMNPENTVFSIKRLIGRSYSEKDVQEEVKTLPYKVEKADGGVKVKMGEKSYTPQEISALILQKLKADAESYLGEKVTEAVITVPAYFNDSERQATKDAGTIAGLEVKRIINEPTAAALAYGLEKKKEEKIAVYDFGGGTFDISILELGDGVFEVLATNGDTHLGGDDVDQALIGYIITEFKKDQGIDLSKDATVLQRLKEAAEKTKCELSTAMQSEINIPFITTDSSGTPKHLIMTITRAKLEEIARALVERTIEPCKKALKDAGLQPKDINEIILVGGQTRMPLIQEKVKEIFGKESLKGVNPDEVVAIGAAIQGGVLGGEVKDILLLDVTPLSLGIETYGGIDTKLIERNTTIPTSETEVFTTAADNQTSVEVHVVQGEREMASDNKTLGRFILDGILPAPRGVPQVEVTFDIDANGILNVNAKDRATGKEQRITITASSGLSKDEVEKMKKEAEANSEEDKKKREVIEAKNHADALVYTSEKTLKDAGDKVSEDDKKDVEEKIAALKEAISSDDQEKMEKATSELSEAIQKVGAAMYQQPQEAPAEEAKEEEKKDDEGPIEGEVVS